MSFKDQSFATRFTAMGDEAEAEFERRQTGGYVRYGLNRPPLQMSALSPLVRYTPDYLTSKCFVEVQGVGRDRIVKLKHEKTEALRVWNAFFPLELFLWDRSRQDATQIPWPAIELLLPLAETGMFPEGKPYHAINIDTHVWSPS